MPIIRSDKTSKEEERWLVAIYDRLDSN